MKRTKKIIAIISTLCAIAVLVCAFSGCASSSPEMSDSSYATGTTVPDSYYESSGEYSYGANYSDDAYNSAETGEELSEKLAAENGDYVRKIIRNANLEITADNAYACRDEIVAKAKELGGYESSGTVRKNSSEYSSWVYIDLTLKLPPEQLDAFIEGASAFGEVTYSNVSADEITEQYYDIVTRLESKEKALESYYALLEKAETVTEILEIQSYINGLTEDIESLQGTLRYYDSRVDESTVYIYITQYSSIEPSDEFSWNSLNAESFGKLIKNGFLSVVNFLWSALLWIAIILVAGSPIIVPAIILAVVFTRRAKKKKAEKAENKPEDKAEVKEISKK